MQLRGTAIVVDTVVSKKLTVSGTSMITGSGSSVTLSEFQSGGVVLLDRTAGQTFVLPDAKPGLNYEFIVAQNLANNTFIIQANAASVSYCITGAVFSMIDNLTSGTTFLSKGSNAAGVAYQRVELNSGTTGGRIGSYITVTALSANTWHVSGVTSGTGAILTPFQV